MTVSIGSSDIGTRRTDAEAVDGVEHFAIVADTGTTAAFVRTQPDWRSASELRDFASRLIDAAAWLEGH